MEALNDVIEDMDKVSEATFSRCRPIIGLLKANLDNWQKENEAAEVKVDQL
jgi:hypothetical protein